MEIRIKNQLSGTIDFCIGQHEYQLEPEQDVIAPVEDGDCIYFDQLIPGRKRTPAEKALSSIIAVIVNAKKGKWQSSDALLWIWKIVDAYEESPDKAGADDD